MTSPVETVNIISFEIKSSVLRASLNYQPLLKELDVPSYTRTTTVQVYHNRHANSHVGRRGYPEGRYGLMLVHHRAKNQ